MTNELPACADSPAPDGACKPEGTAHREPPLDPRAPVGLFDSGVGGLSVWRELVSRMPLERTIYLADNAHCPYGRRSAEELTALATRLVEALLGQRCKLIVVACNTATAAAIDALRARFAVPFVGMEPAVKPAALNSRTGVIGILATEGTFHGRLFRETSARFAAGVRQVVRVGDGLVELVEAGRADTDEARRAVEAHVRPMLAEGIDHLVLGCTHFPFLLRHIEAVAGPHVAIVNPAGAVARQVERLLGQRQARAPADGPGRLVHRFVATGSPGILRRMVEDLGWTTSAAKAGWPTLEGAQEFEARAPIRGTERSSAGGRPPERAPRSGCDGIPEAPSPTG